MKTKILERALEMACQNIRICPFSGPMNISCEDCEARKKGIDCGNVLPKMFIRRATAEIKGERK